MAVDIGNDENFNSYLLENSKVIVKFHADWCGNCRLFAPKFKRLSKSSEHIDVGFLDVNAEQNVNTRKAAGVTNLPYFAAFRDGELVGGFSGTKEEAVIDLINRL